METKTGNQTKFVTFVIGSEEFCVDIMSVREIRGWAPSTRLPHAPHYVSGVINLRGAVLPIVDLAARLGRPLTAPTARHVIVVVQIGTQVAGLLVDAVTGILIEPGSVMPTPDIASDLSHSFIKGLLALQGRLISVLGVDNILPEPDRVPGLEKAA